MPISKQSSPFPCKVRRGCPGKSTPSRSPSPTSPNPIGDPWWGADEQGPPLSHQPHPTERLATLPTGHGTGRGSAANTILTPEHSPPPCRERVLDPPTVFHQPHPAERRPTLSPDIPGTPGIHGARDGRGSPTNTTPPQHLTTHEHLFYYQYRVVQREAFTLATLIGTQRGQTPAGIGGLNLPHPVVKARCERESTFAPGRTSGRCMDSNSPGYTGRKGEPERLTHAAYVGVVATLGIRRVRACRSD